MSTRLYRECRRRVSVRGTTVLWADTGRTPDGSRSRERPGFSRESTTNNLLIHSLYTYSQGVDTPTPDLNVYLLGEPADGTGVPLHQSFPLVHRGSPRVNARVRVPPTTRLSSVHSVSVSLPLHFLLPSPRGRCRSPSFGHRPGHPRGSHPEP